MATTDIQKAILQAKVEGVLRKIIVKTNTENVMFDESTTLAAKLAETFTALSNKANSSDVTTQIQTAINDLIGGAPDTYNTLQEIAEYIAAHEEVKDALQKSIGDKLDKTTFTTFCNSIAKLGTIAGKSKIAESDLEEALAAKVNAAAEGNHSHSNKTVLDGIDSDDLNAWDGAAGRAHEHANSDVLNGISAEKITAWDGAAGKAHEHSNGAVLNGITSAKISEWDGKATVYISKNEPQDLKNGDLWLQLID